MSWPTRTWTQDGWQDFKSPLSKSRPKGLPADWEDHRKGVMGDATTFWDIIDNPLYEAAANACDIDWNEWVAESLAQIGSEKDYKAALDYVDNQSGTLPTRVGGVTFPWDRIRSGRGSNYDNLTPEQQAIADKFPDRQSTMGVAGFEQGDHGGAASGGYAAGLLARRLRSGKGGKELKDWGVDRGTFGGITDELDEMSKWLKQTIKTHALQDAPIIRRGPEGSDYGIDGDIWEHYGLDKAPGPPKEMDVNYDFNLIAAKPSNMTYKTPEGYPVVDKSTESIPFGDTHYAKWSAENDNG